MNDTKVLKQLTVVIDPKTGLKVVKWQFYVKLTNKNYVEDKSKLDLTYEFWKDGFRTLSHRIKIEDVGVVQCSNIRDSASYFSRSIFYLPENEETACNLLYETVRNDLQTMQNNINNMVNFCSKL